MDLGLSGKLALVTGSTAGIGLATAVALAREGARVVVNGRTQERVDAAIDRVRTAVPAADVSGVAADLSGAEGAAAIVARHPAVDVLVNNVGIFGPRPFEEIPDEEWLRFFQTNVMSGVRLSRAYLPRMVKAGWGRIVFVSSESALQIPAEMVHYGMTKTAQLAVARGLAETAAGTGVTVNSVLAGPTWSEGVGTFLGDLARSRGIDERAMEREFFTHVRPSSLLKRFETPEEIASMIAYVCGQPASGTNGAALRVDGGVVRSIA